jgi:hypothetical protein
MAKLRIAATCLFLLGAASGAWAQEPLPLKRQLGMSLTYLGGGLRIGFLRHWSAEAHFYFDKTDSENGEVQSKVGGLKVERHFYLDKRLQPYGGIAGDRVSSQLKDGSGSGSDSTTYENSGYAFGAFAGLEYYLLRRLALTMDVGPYYVKLKETASGTSDSGVDFVLSTALNFYFF